MRTFEQYFEGLRKMRPNVYLGGKLVPRDDPAFLPGIKVIGATFELVNDPRHQDLTIAVSHLTGRKINRFTHIHQSQEDLLKKQKMTRMYCQRVGRCV